MTSATSYREVLAGILDVLEYSDKELYIERFDRMNHLEAMSNIYETLPEDQQDKFIKGADDPESIMQLVDKETYVKEIIQVTANALSTFVNHVQPVMSSSQRAHIARLLQVN